MNSAGLNVSQQNLCSRSDCFFEYTAAYILFLLLYSGTAHDGRVRQMYADLIHVRTHFYDPLLLFQQHETEKWKE